MTIYDYFDRLTSIGLDEEISEEFDNKIIDALEIIRNHEIGDFENVIDDEPTDEEMMSSFGTKWHDGL
tara:strand:- start:140 stop:343 length:204 start_codon:yes stop_codon:yes gene_type:complete